MNNNHKIQNKIELLAPAGSLDALKVALYAGADAVYISGKSFGARAFAKNFTNEEIKEAVRFAHVFRKKVYVTINTLLYNEEFNELSEYLDFLYQTCVDALIVQDLGVLHFIKEKYPDFIVHASTQMSIYNEIGISNLKKLGVSRAILARELQIEKVKELSNLGLETEIFVHGALCYAYSGNCLMSYAIGKRSGNRGACAQPCRKTYSLIENGKKIIDKQSIISMKDLNTLESLDEILKSNVTSLKIEGRMKSLEYVYTIVSLYRKKIDAYYNNIKFNLSNKDLKDILVTFNRGFTKGYLFNDLNINRTTKTSVNHLGIKIGKVAKVEGKKITINLTDDLCFNDGIRFKGLNETGAYVNEMYLNNVLVKKAKSGSKITLILNIPCKVNDDVYKTVDSNLVSMANNIVKNFDKKVPITFHIKISYNNPISLSAICCGFTVTVCSDTLTEVAKNPLPVCRIKEQLSKLNDTLFSLDDAIVDYDNIAFFTIKQINELRRKAVSKLELSLINNVERNNLPLVFDKQNVNDSKQNINIEAVVFNKKQKEICLNNDIKTVYYKETYANRFAKTVNDNSMIHNLGELNLERKNLVPSIYMNIINNESVKILEKLGIKKTYLSSELEIDQLSGFNDSNLELGYFIYGKEDLMVSNQCFIASSKGYDHKKCNECLKNKYKLIDEYNNEFDVMTDFENCDIRILNYQKRNCISQVNKLIELGINNFLLIFTNETEEEIVKVINDMKKAIKN